MRVLHRRHARSWASLQQVIVFHVTLSDMAPMEQRFATVGAPAHLAATSDIEATSLVGLAAQLGAVAA